MRVPVLMYHYVECWQHGDPWRKRWLYVCPEAFDAQMALLAARGWQTVTAPKLAAALRSGTCLPRKTFVVTLDDGWLSQYDEAAPILERYGFRGSFYVIVGRMLDSAGLPVQERQHFDVAQAQDLVARGHAIGNHTMDHRRLARALSATLEHEIADAQRALDDNGLGQSPLTFVYPYGSYSDAAEDYLAGQGYVLAFTTRHGARESAANPLAARRLRVGRATTPAALVRRMARFRNPY